MPVVAFIAIIQPPPSAEEFIRQYICVGPTVGKSIQYSPSVFVPVNALIATALVAAAAYEEPSRCIDSTLVVG